MPAACPEKSYRRRGRPPASQAGQFDERILQVATSLFLDRGFGRTTLDLVAQHAEVGKSSLYARYPSKGDLFAAVVSLSIQTMFDHLAPVPEGLGLARIFHRSRATNEYGIALVCPKIQVSNLDQRAGNAEAKLYRRN